MTSSASSGPASVARSWSTRVAELVDPGRGLAEPTSSRQAENIQPFHAAETPNILDADVRDTKIAELYKQLQELRRRTKTTRTFPEGSHHSGIDLFKPKIIPPVKTYINVPDKPIIELKEIIHLPGFERNDRSEYGTPDGPKVRPRTSSEFSIRLLSITCLMTGTLITTDLEREINLRILKRLDRQAVLDHNAAMAAAPPVTFDIVAEVPDIIETHVPDLSERSSRPRRVSPEREIQETRSRSFALLLHPLHQLHAHRVPHCLLIAPHRRRSPLTSISPSSSVLGRLRPSSSLLYRRPPTGRDGASRCTTTWQPPSASDTTSSAGCTSSRPQSPPWSPSRIPRAARR